eukprot:470285_1
MEIFFKMNMIDIYDTRSSHTHYALTYSPSRQNTHRLICQPTAKSIFTSVPLNTFLVLTTLPSNSRQESHHTSSHGTKNQWQLVEVIQSTNLDDLFCAPMPDPSVGDEDTLMVLDTFEKVRYI